MPARKTAKSEPFTLWWSRLKLSDGRTVRYIGLTKIKGMIWVENLKTGGQFSTTLESVTEELPDERKPK